MNKKPPDVKKIIQLRKNAELCRHRIEMGRIVQAARHLSTGWTAQVSEIFLRAFMSKLLLGSTQPPIK